MEKNKKRIELLSKPEVDELYARPIFNKHERGCYFSLSEKEISAMESYSNENTRLYFILQLGYFKAKQQFYSLDLTEIMDDVLFVKNNYFFKSTESFKKITREYINSQKEFILELFNYQLFSDEVRIKTLSHLCELIKIVPKAHNALRQLLTYFENQQIILPTYRSLQDLFTEAYSLEKERLSKIMLLIPQLIQSQLKSMMKNEDGITKLNLMRGDQKDFTYTALKGEVKKAHQLLDLYEYSKTFIPETKLSRNAVRYYADLTEQYPAARLRRLTEPQQWLYLICFSHHRYEQFMDNLITSFIYHVRATLAEGKTYAKAAQTDYHEKLLLDFPKLAEFLLWFPQQKNKSEVRAPELSAEAYKILPEEQFAPLSQLIAGHVFDKKGAKWEFYGKSSRRFALYLRPIITSVTFDFYIKDHFVMTLINLLKDHYSTGKPPATLKISDHIKLKIPDKMLKYLKKDPDDDLIDPHRLEFFVYQKMFHHLNKGRLFCNESVSYADLDCDLIPEEMVDDVIEISEKFGFPRIPIYCDQHLDEMLKKLDEAWDRTTDGIDSGSNKGFKIKTVDGITDWTLLYDASEELEDHPLNTLPTIEITNLMKFIGSTVGIWNQFSHVKNLYIKRKNPDIVFLTACILAEAFGLSTDQMAKMSDLNANSLSSTREDFFSVGIMCEVNNKVVDHIYGLAIFKLWNLMGDLALADADGQKIPSTNQTIQARYSEKFLGKERGISIYTLLVNFVAINAKNIGPNEYEGHSLYDVVYGNKTAVKIDLVTGDNHSLNKLNFIILDSINIGYVPSIKNIRAAADELYSVKDPDYYKGILKPKGKIKTVGIYKFLKILLPYSFFLNNCKGLPKNI